MGVERELKFAVDEQTALALPRHALLLLAPAPRRERLQTWYFDTPDLRLAGAGIALRLRQTPRTRVLTVKTRGSEALGHRRGEWEWEAAERPPGAAPDTLSEADLQRALRETPLGKLGLQAQQLAQLRGVFDTAFERCAWDLSWCGSRIELALDVGACGAWREGARVEVPIREVELELRDGDWEHVWELSWTLAQDLPLLLSPVDKARRAGALAQAQRVAALPEPARVDPRAGLGAAAQTWLGTACAQLAVWAERIVTADEARDVHQLRVVLRRLRITLRWLRPHAPSRALPWLVPELRWAHHLAGLVRDADVALALLQGLEPGAAEAAQALAAQLVQQRRIQREALCAYLQSPRFGRLLLALGHWSDVWGRDGDGRRALRELALRAVRGDHARWSEALRSCTEAVRQASTQAATPAQRQALHALRIRAKRLRLSVERLGHVLPSRQGKDWAAWGPLATRLQSELGAWHDAERLLQHAQEAGLASPALQQALSAHAALAALGALTVLEQAGVVRV